MTQDKNTQDDLDWFDGLIGKSETGQGALLRRELDEIERAASAEEDLTQDWHRLRFAMRRERKQFGWHFLAMAASVLIFFSTVYLLKPIADIPQQETMMRGTTEQAMVSAEAAQDAGLLQEELGRLGVQVFRNSSASKITLRIRLDYPLAGAVAAVLEAHAILLPEEGDLTVSFIQPPQ